MNVDWIKIPALFWGVETIYKKVLFEGYLESLQHNLEQVENTVQGMRDNYDLGIERKNITSLKTKIDNNIRKVKTSEHVSTIFMVGFPFFVMLFVLYNSYCCFHTYNPGFFGSYWNLLSPSIKHAELELPFWLMFVFSFQFLARLLLATWWVFSPLIEYKKLENKINFLSARLPSNDLSPIEPQPINSN